MQTKRFQRHKEDFDCEKCGLRVEGSGYTNHCPSCLWSKHVDVNPGDRKESCQGMMEPIDVELKGDRNTIIHHCIKCGLEKKNKSVKGDNASTILEISKND